MRILAAIAAGVGFCAFGATALADGPGTQLSRTETKAATGVTQTSSVADGSMHIDVTKGYVLIPAKDVPPLLQQLQARAPAAQTVGAVAPANKRPGAADYWLAVVSYDPVGHVPETGADELGAITFIDSVKAARPAEPALESFAVAPSYDPLSKTLVWGEQYAKGKSANSLRHETRVLGRSGVAGIAIIARPAQLEAVKTEAKNVRAMVSFNDSQRYGDFAASTDRASPYNLPGLIDGKLRAGPAEETPVETAAQSFALSDVLPGGRYGWASYLAGGLALLMIIGAIGSAVTKRRSGGDSA